MRIIKRLAELFSPGRSGPGQWRLPLQAKVLAAVVPAALFGALALMPASAGAFPPCENNVLCSGTVPHPKIRDDFDKTTLITGEEVQGYGASALAVNTHGRIALCAESLIGELCNEVPEGYAFFGLKLDNNPTTEECKAEHEEATGWVTLADLQNTESISPGGARAVEPVFAGEGPAVTGPPVEPPPGGYGPWEISVRSDECAENPGEVTVSNVHLLFPELALGAGVTAVGTFTGSYVQPEEGEVPSECPGGGVKLDIDQPGVVVTAANPETARTEEGKGSGAPAFICFVSGNNYVYPETAPTWEPLIGSIWKD